MIDPDQISSPQGYYHYVRHLLRTAEFRAVLKMLGKPLQITKQSFLTPPVPVEGGFAFLDFAKHSTEVEAKRAVKNGDLEPIYVVLKTDSGYRVTECDTGKEADVEGLDLAFDLVCTLAQESNWVVLNFFPWTAMDMESDPP